VRTVAGAVPRAPELSTPLHDVTFVALDLETTGASPGFDAITEIGAVKYRGGERLGTFETLVNPGVPIPPFVTVLTGITDAMVLPAPPIDEVLPALLEFVGNAVLVGHNFRFDTGFLDAALVRRGHDRLDHVRVDTLGLARRLLHEDVPDLKLATIAAHLRVPTEPCHRAFDDAAATAEVLHALLERAGTLGVLGLDDLLAVPRLRAHPSSNTLRLTARAPRRPGVYRMLGRGGEVLLVGRATNLRARIRAHFHTAPAPVVPLLVRLTRAIDWIECADELEVAVRHARLVREHRPRFNREQSTWRSRAYVKRTLDRRPRFTVAHTVKDVRVPHLGPLPDRETARAVRDACETAAALTADPADDAVPRAFDGDGRALVAILEDTLTALVAAEEYEAAAGLRDRLATIGPALDELGRVRRLCDVPQLRVMTTRGVVTFRHGRLHTTDDPCGEDVPTAVIGREELDEVHAVAAWLEREIAAGRAEVLDPLPR
jgi:DNA polymerase-3 subunit epsilon